MVSTHQVAGSTPAGGAIGGVTVCWQHATACLGLVLLQFGVRASLVTRVGFLGRMSCFSVVAQ